MALQLCTELWKQLIVEKNKDVANLYKGKRCFVLATGPSIKTQDLSALQHEICISVSNFFVHPQYDIIKPHYHCIAPYHPPLTEEAMQAWMDDLATHTKNNQNLSLFFSVSDIKRNLQNNRFSNRNVYFLDFSGTAQETIDSDLDLSSRVIPPQSVSIMALMIAIFMGFSEIYLLGCDHDWLLHMYESRHFYDEAKHAFNHFDTQNSEWEDTDLEAQCHCYINLWQQYKLLRHVASRRDISIINATKGGMLDVFPRTDLANIIKMSPS